MNIADCNFSGQKVLIRVDFNVPLNDDFKVTDRTRIKAAVPTILKVLDDGGTPVLMSHLGRPKGTHDPKYSLAHIVSAVEEEIGTSVVFADEYEVALPDVPEGHAVLLENLRFNPGEKAGDETFAELLASLGDFYVNDAFGTAHRAHASTATIAGHFEGRRCFGYLLAKELESLDKVMSSPERPYLAIVGGAKVSSKIEVINSLLEVVDHLIVGGGMTFTFIKALGGSIGTSLVEDDKLDVAKEILAKAEEKGVKIHLPVDSVNADAFSNDAAVSSSAIDTIPDGLMGLDVGEQTIANFEAVIAECKTILWNGPVGVFEFDNFSKGTEALGRAIAKVTSDGAFSLVGGGDSVAAINKFGLKNDVSYVSTGGGAMLEYLEGKPLPGVVAMNG